MREVQYRSGAGQWQPLGLFERLTLETQWIAPASGTYRFRHRLVDRNRDPLTDWGYSDPIRVTAPAPPPIYGAVAADGCPPANRGVPGQLWIAPDGRVWTYAGDPWTTAIPSDVPVEGASGGLLARFDGVTWAYEPRTAGNELFSLGIALAAQRRLPQSLDGLYVAQMEFRVGTSSQYRWQLDLSAVVPATPEATGADLPDGVAADLLVALRKEDGSTTWTTVANDLDDPYFWVDASNATFFTGTSSIPAKLLFARHSARCASDPLSPWVPEPDLGVVGKDGVGIEWIHSLAATDDALPNGELPPNTLPYDAALDAQGADVGVRIVGGAVSTAAAGGRVWHDNERQTTAATPFDVAMFRRVPGQPARGAVPTAAWGDWQGPVFRRLWGESGEDGAGWERVFALTSGSDEPSVDPSDTAAYDSYPPAPSDPAADTIYDDLPSVTSALPYGWVAERKVPGAPAKNAAHDDSWGDWSDWQLREHYGEDGEDGAGWERVFALTSGSDEPSVDPSDTAAYDSYPPAPSDPAADTIYDDLPSVTSALPYGWVAERKVPGAPAKNAAHDDSWGDWSDWQLREHYGEDGEDGEDGSDGAGKEWCYAVTSGSDEPSVDPSNSAAYDSFRAVPSTPRANTIYDDYPGVSADHPYGWVNVRKVPGSPAAGDAKQSSWGNWGGWKLHEHFGLDAVQVSRSQFVVMIEHTTGGWSTGNVANDTIVWTQGSTTLERINVFLDARVSSGVLQCRMRLSGIGTDPQVLVDESVVRTSTYTTTYKAVPCEHKIDVGGAICAVAVVKGAEPLASRAATTFFSWTSGTDYVVGDVIVFRYPTDSTGADAYRCITAHTGSARNRPPGRATGGASWQTYWERA